MGLSADEKRKRVVEKIMSRKGKNEYTYDLKKRLLVGSGYGDCSSTVQWAYKEAINMDIGGSTPVQYTNRNGIDVDIYNNSIYPDESKLKLGDLIYFKGKIDEERAYCDYVGHVEMYIGDGKLMGHGSGTGPRIESIEKYCNNRGKKKHYLKTKRFILDNSDKQNTNNSSKTEAKAELKEEKSAKKQEQKTNKSSVTTQRNSVSSSSPSNTYAYLKKGSKGSEVETLQKQLLFLNYDPKGVDGSFGPNTEKAVIAFQKVNNLEPDGIVGPITREALKEQVEKNLLKKGVKGKNVEKLQKNLTKLGFDTHGTSGTFDSNTKKAVIAFQKKYNMEQDGIVGPETMYKINELLKKKQKLTIGTATKKTVVEGATLKCDKGSKTSKLKVPDNHGGKVNNKNVATIKDKKANKNIFSFGTCSITKKTCNPNISSNWKEGNSKYTLDNVKTLTTSSYCCCLNGGVIKITNSGQSTDSTKKILTTKDVPTKKDQNKTVNEVEKKTENNSNQTTKDKTDQIDNVDNSKQYVTKEQLKKMGFINVTDAMVGDLNRVLIKYDITTKERIRHFLAQCLYEGGKDKDLLEDDNENGTYLASKPYGKKYCGAGYIQFTFKYHYQAFATYMILSEYPELKKYGKHCPASSNGKATIDKNYSKIVEGAEKLNIDISKYTKIVDEGSTYVAKNFPWEASGYFWEGEKKLNEKVDKFKSNDVVNVDKISIVVLGGNNGSFGDRQKCYKTVCKYY